MSESDLDPDALPTRTGGSAGHDPQRVSRRQALAVGGGMAAVATVGSLAAASPAGAAPGGRARPQTVLSLSLDQAEAALKAALREAARAGVAAYVVVVDACGDVKASSRQDGNSRASLTLAPLKAETALAFRTPTAVLAQRAAADAVRVQSLLAAGFTLLGGGVPISADGQVVGAIGVGGGTPEQDVAIAEAGVRAVR